MRTGVAAYRRRMPALLAMLLSLAAHAAGLYTAQVPVNSQDEAERAQALKTALGQVVTRASGDPAAASRPEIAKALAQADRYVQQFQYQEEVVNESGQPQARLSLIAQFDRDAVDRLVGSGGPKEAASDKAATPASTASGTYHIWVGGVRTGRDYARAMGALAGSESVRDVQIELARGDGMQLRVATVGSLAHLLDGLNAGAVMRVTNAKPPLDGIDALLDMKP